MSAADSVVGAAETPMSDHVARFWKLLAEHKVHITVECIGEYSSSLFPDAVAKAIVAAQLLLRPGAEKGEGQLSQAIYIKLGQIYELFSTIKGDFTDPRDKCREGWTAVDELQAMLAAAPAPPLPAVGEAASEGVTYRKREADVEAWQLTLENWKALETELAPHFTPIGNWKHENDIVGANIQTPGDVEFVVVGEWIVRDVDGGLFTYTDKHFKENFNPIIGKSALHTPTDARLPLSRGNADKIEAEMRRLEADPAVTKTELRLFMQLPMPCGHATGNLLTCSEPPYGCVICGESGITDARRVALEETLAIIENEPELDGRPPANVVQAMKAVGPIENARAAVRASKKSIAEKVRALLPAKPEEGKS